MLKDLVETDRSQMAVWPMRVACWVPKAKPHTNAMSYLLLSHCNTGCMNAR